jgi:hypothetical protein
MHVRKTFQHRELARQIQLDYNELRIKQENGRKNRHRDRDFLSEDENSTMMHEGSRLKTTEKSLEQGTSRYDHSRYTDVGPSQQASFCTADNA